MIIEKKSSLIDPKRVKIPYNYVLVKPDPDFDEYHYRGRSTGVAVSNFIYDGEGRRVSIKERNRAITGVVYAVPNRIYYKMREARQMSEGKVFAKKIDGIFYTVDRSTRDIINDMKLKSMEYEVDVELQVGDRIKFSYMVHERAMDNNSIIETTEGPMYFITYDQIFMSIDDQGNPKRMVNGYILVESDIKELEKDGAVKGKEKGQLFIVDLSDGEKRERKAMVGTVVLAGTPCRGYKSIPDARDPNTVHTPGERLIFDPRGAINVDLMNHQLTEKPQYLIHRIDIWLSSKENPNFENVLIEK